MVNLYINTKYEAGDQRLDNGFIKLELSFVTTFDEGQIITFQVADHEIENWNVKAFYLETLLED